MSAATVKISKFLSLVLRHQPEVIGITLDEQGWVEVETLLRQMNAHQHPVTRAQLEQVVRDNDKQRFAFSPDGARIRASQGHSVAVELGLAPQVPPARLYHGTATRTLAAIRAEGIKPGGRQQVHLSLDVATALKVGQRHGRPVVLTVRAAELHAAGHVFTCSANGVWLTDHVPTAYLEFPQHDGWGTFGFLVDSYETERLKTLAVWSEFADADLPYRPAPLARSLHEQLVHQCLSEDGWMKKMLGVDAGLPPLPVRETRLDFLQHYAAASARRLELLRAQDDAWFQATVSFFDVPRPRTWVLLRRLTHSAHHRAQLTVYLRLLGKPLYSTYGPTADTGGLYQNHAAVIYRYADVDDLLAGEAEGGRGPTLPGPGEHPAGERPG